MATLIKTIFATTVKDPRIIIGAAVVQAGLNVVLKGKGGKIAKSRHKRMKRANKGRPTKRKRKAPRRGLRNQRRRLNPRRIFRGRGRIL